MLELSEKMEVDSEEKKESEKEVKEEKYEMDWEKLKKEYKRPCADKKCKGMNYPDAESCIECGRIELPPGRTYDLSKRFGIEEKRVLSEKLVDLLEEVQQESLKTEDKKDSKHYPFPVPYNKHKIEETPFADYQDVAGWLKKEYKQKAESPFFQSCPGMGLPAQMNTWIGNCLPLTEDQKRMILIDCIIEELVKKGEKNDTFTREVVTAKLKEQEYDWDPDRSEENKKGIEDMLDEIKTRRKVRDKRNKHRGVKQRKSKLEKDEEEAEISIMETHRKRREEIMKKTRQKKDQSLHLVNKDGETISTLS